MLDRPAPASLWWLAGLIGFSITISAVAGLILYHQSRTIARTQAMMTSGGDWQRGKVAIARYGCGACHEIPGIRGALGRAGPDLAHVGKRTTIAGSFSNDPQTMVRWIAHPQTLRPGSGMPEQGVTSGEARDMTAYLYAQD